MATYTDNYNLIKPTYAETADIVPLNNNFEKIDEVMHSSQISLAPAYDQTKEYAAGDTVMYELLMYKCTAPTTGVWDPSKWERTTASESGGGGSAELDILGEASGAVASFADGASAGLAKCIAEIVPKQAGSGTPSPSNVRAISGYTAIRVNVTNKNHLRMTLNGLKNRNTGGTWNGNVYTLNNLTFTVNADTNGVVNSITVNGTNANTYTRFTLDLPILISGQTYTLSGAPSGYSGTNATIYLGNSPATIGITNPAISDGVPVTFTPTQTGEPTANINVNAGVTVNNAVFYPQIEIGTEATAFEPYKGSTTTTPLGQTVYGGQLNVLTGELTIDRVYQKLTSDLFTAFNNTLKAGFTDGDYLGKHIVACNALAPSYSYSTATDTISVRTQDGRIIAVPSWASECTDLASFKTAYANQTELEVVHTITPQTVQLTPQEVNSLLGQNNISADTGDIDIVYVKASAPIQPNPTGTPTATLKKLGIEGTVFEVPSGGGGGGSSETRYSITEQKIGTVEDENGIAKDLYERMWIGTIPSYTSSATGCILGTMPSDYDEIIDIKGSLKGLVKAYGTVNGLDYAGWRGDLHINTSNQILLFATNPTDVNSLVGGRYRVIIQYTKITD